MSEMDPRAEDWAEEEDETDADDAAWVNAEHGLETSEADAMEQQAAVGTRYTGQHGRSADVPYDVNEADAAEQSIDVDLDDDDYR